MVDELVNKGFDRASGQICFNVKRIYVHRDHHREFLDRYTAAVDRLVVGDGLDPRSTMGPVNNRPQFDRVTALVERTRDSGATVTTVGSRLDPAGWEDGLFLLPSIVSEVPPVPRW